MRSTRVRRLGALIAGSALTAGALTVAPASHAVSPEPVALSDAITWLESQRDPAGLLAGFGSPDYGLTADYALGLHELGDRSTELESVLTALIAAKDGAMGDGENYASVSATAQALWATQQAGESDGALVTRLQDLLAVPGDTVDTDGKPETPPVTLPEDAAGRAIAVPYSSWTGTIEQAWTVVTLAASESANATTTQDALEFLLKQQCEAGWFRYSWSAPDAPDQSCDADATSFADPDTTAYVVILLGLLADPSEAVEQARERAVTWLLAQRLPNGAFAPGYDPTTASANTTGLAARALALTGHRDAASKAALWLRQHQLAPLAGCPSPGDSDRGAIASGAEAFDAARSKGIAAATRGSWQFAAGQAFPALAYVPAGNPQPVVSAPVGYQRAGTSVTVTVGGANAGDLVCFAAGDTRKTLRTGATTTAIVTLPTTTGDTTVSATTAGGAVGSATIKALGAKRIPFLAARKVKRKHRLNVAVSGLAAGERVTIRFRGKVVRTGVASPAGNYIARIKVGRKLGKAKVNVAGEFADIRTNTKTVRVVR